MDENRNSTDRCAVCGKRVAQVVDALDHYLSEHPRSELLHDTLSDVSVDSECSECGDSFTTTVSIGIDAKIDEAMVTVPAYCDNCVADDPLTEIMVRGMEPTDVLSQEVSMNA